MKLGNKHRIDRLNVGLALAASLAAAWLGVSGPDLAWMPLCIGFAMGSGGHSDGSALVDAAVAGDWASVENLLDACIRAKIDVASEAGIVLELLVGLRSLDFRLELVEKLLSAGADPNGSREEAGQADFDPALGTPLYRLTISLPVAVFDEMDALDFRRKESLALNFAARLLRAGADPNARFSDGRSLIAMAAAHSASMTKLLLAAGADPNPAPAKAFAGASPLHLASGKAPFVSRSAHHATCVDCVEIIEALVAAGANLEARNNKGDTPLHLAASKGSAAAVEALLAAGADLEARNDRKLTPEASAEGAAKDFFRAKQARRERDEIYDCLGPAPAAATPPPRSSAL